MFVENEMGSSTRSTSTVSLIRPVVDSLTVLGSLSGDIVTAASRIKATEYLTISLLLFMSSPQRDVQFESAGREQPWALAKYAKRKLRACRNESALFL